MRRTTTLLFLLSCIACLHSSAQTIGIGQLKSGDLLFLDLDCGPMCDAIEQVTPAWKGMHFSHVGILVAKGDSQFVLEALPPAVKLTPLSRFARYTTKPMAAGRWTSPLDTLVPRAIGMGMALIGAPYDSEFRMDNGKWYCSELVFEIFKSANNGVPLFSTAPMTYCLPLEGPFFKTSGVGSGRRTRLQPGQFGFVPFPSYVGRCYFPQAINLAFFPWIMHNCSAPCGWITTSPKVGTGWGKPCLPTITFTLKENGFGCSGCVFG
jgi:hypothetical protein